MAYQLTRQIGTATEDLNDSFNGFETGIFAKQVKELRKIVDSLDKLVAKYAESAE
jgi:exonuclease VII small subunit